MQLTEQEIITGLRNQDRDAFEAMVRQYSRLVYYLSRNILGAHGTREDLEECVSDVFVDAWQKVGKYSEKRGGLQTWLLMLAKYRALAYRRRLSGIQVDNIEDYQMEGGPDVEAQLLERETQERIAQAINLMNAVDRELFIRRYYLGESIQNLMSAMGLSRPAIDNRLWRGRKAIKEALANE